MQLRWFYTSGQLDPNVEAGYFCYLEVFSCGSGNSEWTMSKSFADSGSCVLRALKPDRSSWGKET